MNDTNFFGGGIGGTVTPRRRGGSIRWGGGLGDTAQNNSPSNPPGIDGSSFIAGIGTILTAYAVVYGVSRTMPKTKRVVDKIMKRKNQSIVSKVPEATVKGATEIVKGVMP